MVPNHLRWLVPGALCAASLVAPAQTVTPPTADRSAAALRSDPLDARAGVPALTYESPFARFHRWGDDKAIPWRDANDTVARTGGWRVYAREAQQPEPAAAASPAQAPAPVETARPVPPGGAGKTAP